MNAVVAIFAVYLAGVAFIGGILLGDEMRFKHPEYGKAALSAVLWPVAVSVGIYRTYRVDG